MSFLTNKIKSEHFYYLITATLFLIGCFSSKNYGFIEFFIKNLSYTKFLYLTAIIINLTGTLFVIKKILKVNSNFLPMFLSMVFYLILFLSPNLEKLFLISSSMFLFSFSIKFIDEKNYLSILFFCASSFCNPYFSLMLVPLLLLKKYKLFFANLTVLFLSYIAYKAYIVGIYEPFYFTQMNKNFVLSNNYSFSAFFASLGYIIDNIKKDSFYTISLKNASDKIYYSFMLIFILRAFLDYRSKKVKSKKNYYGLKMLLFVPFVVCFPNFLPREFIIIYAMLLPVLSSMFNSKVACNMCAFGFCFWFCLSSYIPDSNLFSFIPQKAVLFIPLVALFVSLMWITAINWRASEILFSKDHKKTI